MKIIPLASSSKGNCYLISDGSSQLLLDCGIPFKDIQRKLKFNMANIEGCLVTHEHKDHSKAIKEVAKVGIDVYSSKGTFESSGVESHRLNIVEAKKQFKIGDWTILPFDVQHDAKEPLGFLIESKQGERLLFATDTYYIKYRFNNLHYLLIECNYSKENLNANVENGLIPREMKGRLLKSHFSLENVKEFLKANDLSNVKEIRLIHLSNNNSDSERFKSEIKALTGKVVYVAEP